MTQRESAQVPPPPVHLERVEDDRRPAWRLVDALALGVILVDSRGRILDANHAAELMLRATDGITKDRDGCLRAVRPDATRRLLRAVEVAAAGGGGDREAAAGVFSLSRPSGLRPLQALVSRVDRESAAVWGVMRAAAAAVFLSDPEVGPELSEERVRALLGLTPAEARVAIQLALGASPAEIAERSGVRANTVRWHLKQIYAKTGTRRQAEVVCLLLTGPATLLSPIRVIERLSREP